MLFDPKWSVESPAIYSIEGLIAWLEKQPAYGVYNWHDIQGCLLCKYLEANKGPRPWTWTTGHYHEVFSSLQLYHTVAATTPWTFGAALTRAREVLANR